MSRTQGSCDRPTKPRPGLLSGAHRWRACEHLNWCDCVRQHLCCSRSPRSPAIHAVARDHRHVHSDAQTPNRLATCASALLIRRSSLAMHPTWFSFLSVPLRIAPMLAPSRRGRKLQN